MLYTRLLSRGYSRSRLKKAYNRAAGRERAITLLKKDTKQPDKDVTRFITTYSDQHAEVRMIMQRHWHLITADPTLSKYVGSNPSITFRRSTSIRDRLVKSNYLKPTLEAHQGPHVLHH